MPIWPHKSPFKAKVLGHTLIAAFRTSHPPLIWQFDLEKNHSFTVALQGEEGDLELGVTSPRGEFYPIAHFTDREDAEEAFARVQKALMCRHQPWHWKRAVCWLALAAIVYLLLFSPMVGEGIKIASLLFSSNNPVNTPSGVPLPADQVLHAPSQ